MTNPRSQRFDAPPPGVGGDAPSALLPAGGAGLGVLPGILWAPGRAFARLAAAPRWLGPLLLVAFLTGLGAWTSLSTTLEFQIETTESMLDRLNVPEEQRAASLEKLPDPGEQTPGVLIKNVGGGMLSIVVMGLVGAGVLHLLARLMGHVPTFRQTLALYWAAALVSALGFVIKSALVSAAGTVEVTLGPGALFPDLPFHSAPAILLDLLDVFSLWNLALLGIGAGVMYRISRGAAFGISGIYWILKAVFLAGSRFFVAWMVGAG